MTDDFYLPFSISFPEFAFKRQFGCMLPKLDILILILAYYCNNFQTNKVGGDPLDRICATKMEYILFAFSFEGLESPIILN